MELLCKKLTLYALLSLEIFFEVYKLLKPLLFLFPPERAHHLTVRLLSILLLIPGMKSIFRKIYFVRDKSLEREVFGMNFPNPVGLAAGFDKDGKYFREMSQLGFGFIEIGTVTPKPQNGNPKPRLFRLPKDRALINRMGFNNEGVEAMVRRLKRRDKSRLIVGGNIGKNKITPNEEAVSDYLLSFNALFDYVDYFVVNVSSPNTPNLRELQEKEPLTRLLKLIQADNHKYPIPKPILLKIAPDLTDEQLDDILEIVTSTGIAGIIATNTTISRNGLDTSEKTISAIGNGGLSGDPVTQKSTAVIKYLADKSQGKIPIIAVGGISSPQDAIDKLNAGASLIQIYTGLIYEGPSLIKRINKALLKQLN